MIGLVLVLVGVALVAVGAVVVFGPVALFGTGAGLIVLGLTVDWEALNGNAAPPSP